jgi:diguanylate cyclase (GGDEF)-like protein/PAS domain S-box-containing protein
MDLNNLTKEELVAQLETEQTKQNFFNNVSNVAYFSTDSNRTVVEWNHSCEDLYGYKENEAIGKTIEQLIIPEYQQESFIDDFNNRTSIYGQEVEYRNANNNSIRSYVNSLFISDCYYHVSLDTSKIRQVNSLNTLIKENDINSAYNSELVTISLDKNGYITDYNLLAQKLLGYTKDEVLGRSFVELFIPDSYKEIILNQLQQSFLSKSIKVKSEFPISFKNGVKKIIHWDQMFIKDYRTKSNSIIMVTDCNVLNNSTSEKLEYFANYDTLTDLPNRNLLQNRMVNAINKASRSNQNMITMFINLDNFKSINHTLGYNIGDALLKEVATRLHSQLRDCDTVARFSGDEFVVLFEDVKDELSAGFIAKRVTELFNKPFYINENELILNANMGISFFPSDGNDAKTILNCANMAMLRSKENKSTNFQFFKAQMQEDITKRVELESNLRKAVKNNEFFLEYQPQIDAKSGNIIGVEALVRWTGPEFKTIPPLDFIPVAEDSGLIKEIGHIVLKTAIRDMKKLHDDGFNTLKVAINISGIQLLQSQLINEIDQILEKTKFDPNFLELELTESVLVKNIDRASSVLKSFQQRGIKISIDDFGTGYSSLNYLKKLPVDSLKIDQSFIENIENSDDDKVIVNTIIAMAQNLGFQVIAEGVEDEYQRAYLIEKSCDMLQGYYFSKPLRIDKLHNMLSKDCAIKNKGADSDEFDEKLKQALERYTVPLQRSV